MNLVLEKYWTFLGTIAEFRGVPLLENYFVKPIAISCTNDGITHSSIFLRINIFKDASY